ncbi:MAG: hypothetical protein R3Y45_03465 [Bacillota bacterium]
MKREVLIHKVIITAEARFDYEEVMEIGELPKDDIKNLIEDYLSLKDGEYQDCDVKYFSVKYLDESVGKYLKLFLYKGERFKSMQMWRLVGICRDKDWNEELEDCGQIRNWHKLQVGKIKDKSDWVKRLQAYRAFEIAEWEWQESEWENQYGEYKENIKEL